MTQFPGTASTAIAGSEALLLQLGEVDASSHLRIIEVHELLNERKLTCMSDAAHLYSFLKGRVRLPFAAFAFPVD